MGVVAENARLRTDLDALRATLGATLSALQQRVVGTSISTSVTFRANPSHLTF